MDICIRLGECVMLWTTSIALTAYEISLLMIRLMDNGEPRMGGE